MRCIALPKLKKHISALCLLSGLILPHQRRQIEGSHCKISRNINYFFIRITQITNVLHPGIQLVQGGAGVFGKNTPIAGKHHIPPLFFKQRCPQFVFQRRNGTAHRGLAHIKNIGCMLIVLRIRHTGEIAQFPDIHFLLHL